MADAKQVGKSHRKSDPNGPQVVVRQVRSGIGFDRTQKATLKALGLGRMGRTRSLPDNDSVRGMLKCIPHLVEVVSAGEETKS